jgi:hypothetical protein
MRLEKIAIYYHQTEREVQIRKQCFFETRGYFVGIHTYSYAKCSVWDFACVIDLDVAICNILLKLHAILY